MKIPHFFALLLALGIAQASGIARAQVAPISCQHSQGVYGRVSTVEQLDLDFQKKQATYSTRSGNSSRPSGASATYAFTASSASGLPDSGLYDFVLMIRTGAPRPWIFGLNYRRESDPARDIISLIDTANGTPWICKKLSR
jgi:hypothetical protein